MRAVERVTTPSEGLDAELLDFLARRRYLVDNSKAERELGVEHRSLDEGRREYLGWEMEQMRGNEQADATA
jgi:dihydroflavonol-4-reductase